MMIIWDFSNQVCQFCGGASNLKLLPLPYCLHHGGDYFLYYISFCCAHGGVLEFRMHGYEHTVKNHFCSSLLHTFLLYSTSFYPFTDIPLFYSFHHLVFNPLYVRQNPLHNCQGLLLFTRVSVEDPLILTYGYSCNLIIKVVATSGSHHHLVQPCSVWFSEWFGLFGLIRRGSECPIPRHPPDAHS